MLQKITGFFTVDMWSMAEEVEGWKRVAIRSLQVLFIAGRDFVEDKCSIRAAALTFYSTLSLVPVLAILFGVAKGFGFEQSLKTEILESADQNRDIFLQMFTFAENTLLNAKGGIVAGIGIVLLFYTLIRTIGLIEGAFNDIWDIEQPRTWLRKFTDYLSLTLLAPVLVIFSGSATVFISSNVQSAAAKVGVAEMVGPFVNFLINLSPYILIWILFLGIYMIMPNKRVKFVPALIAAVVAGTVYQLVEWVYITFQIGVSSYNGIYGSFAALPLFLVWIQLSWSIILFGGELSFAIQNVVELARTAQRKKTTPYQRFMYSLLIARELLRKTKDQEPSPTADELAEELNLGINRVLNILNDLIHVKLVISVEGDSETRYHIARDSKEVTPLYVAQALMQAEDFILPEEHSDIQHLVDQIQSDIASSKGNAHLRA